MKIYLDACCLSRLTDDQSQARIREEAEAVEQLLAGVRRRTFELLSSEALEDEVRRNPSMERRVEAQTILSFGRDEDPNWRGRRPSCSELGRAGLRSLGRAPPRGSRINWSGCPVND
jgi:hypothetical protein